MSVITMSIGTILIPLAFMIKATSPESNGLAIIAGAIGCFAVILAYINTNKEKAEARESHKELITELKGIREDLKELGK